MPTFKNTSPNTRWLRSHEVAAGKTVELEGTDAAQAAMLPYFELQTEPAPKKKRKYTRRKKVAAVPEAEPVATEGAGSDTSETA